MQHNDGSDAYIWSFLVFFLPLAVVVVVAAASDNLINKLCRHFYTTKDRCAHKKIMRMKNNNNNNNMNKNAK